jgi:hypothetical protein
VLAVKDGPWVLNGPRSAIAGFTNGRNELWFEIHYLPASRGRDAGFYLFGVGFPSGGQLLSEPLDAHKARQDALVRINSRHRGLSPLSL